MKAPLHAFLRSSVVISVLGAAVHGATIQNTNLSLSSNPAVGDIYFYNNPAGNSWTVTGNISVGNGTTADSRLFVGLNNAGANHGLLTLQGNGDATPDSLLLNGYHSADPVLGRLGHVSGGNWTGTIDIAGGLAVTMGGRMMRYEGGVNTINITTGSLNYTTVGFGWTEGAGDAIVSHILGADGSLLVPGVIMDAAGFAAWAQASGSGVELNDITVSAANGLALSFSNNGSFTTITAIPEPGVWSIAPVVAALGCLIRRRR